MAHERPLAASRAATMQVGVAQIESTLGDVEANLRKHLEVIDAARSAGIEMLLFPELSLTGHHAGADALRLAVDRGHAIVQDIACAAGPMCTTFGMIEQGAGAQFYNAAVAVRDAAVTFVHRKVNLATYGRLDDGKHYAAGRRLDTFTVTPEWKAGVMICADTWNPALVHLMAAQGATLLLAPVSSAREAVGAEFDNPAGWDVNLCFHAMTYGLPILMANRVGREHDLTFWGGSRVLDPFGRTIARAPSEGEALVRAEIDFGDVRRARYLLPTVRDADLPLLHREIERLLARADG